MVFLISVHYHCYCYSHSCQYSDITWQRST